MVKYFISRIMLVSIVLLYSTVSYTESRSRIRSIARNKTASYIINNFKILSESQIRKAIKNDSVARQLVTQWVINNIEKFPGLFGIFSKLFGIFSPSAKKIITIITSDSNTIQLTVNNIEKLIESSNGRDLITVVRKTGASADQQINLFITNNIKKLIKSPTGVKLIRDTLQNSPSSQLILNNVERLLKSPEGAVFIQDVIENNPSAKSLIEELMSNFSHKNLLMKMVHELRGNNLGNIEAMKKKLECLSISVESKKEIRNEINRLEHSNLHEAPFIHEYLEWIFALPWGITTEDNLDIAHAKKILDKDHYGLVPIKEKILDFISTRNLKKDSPSPILCFVGPPGTGKTSLGKSIARSLGRKYARIALGGIYDEIEIRGNRRAYSNSMPGRIIKTIKSVGFCNPVIVLDEIDKISSHSSHHGNPAGAMLEVLDPEQNKEFHDNYLEIPFDLSQVMFIATANDISAIPAPLRDRMEIIELSGYTLEEKMQIGQQYLVKKAIIDSGLENKNMSITDAVLQELIMNYTRESGVRQLERIIRRLCSKAARTLVEKNELISFSPDNVKSYLGPRKFIEEESNKEDQIGRVNGLAWTPYGGTITKVEVILMPGKGKLILTGQLGDVMKESAQIALSYARAHAKQFGIDDSIFLTQDLHIHFPAGATPKDGPSGGITILTAIISSLTGQTVNRQYAMTGELNLSGEIMPIGGIKEKILAAKRNNVPHVILPSKNKHDLDDIKDVTNGIDIILVDHADEVLERVLLPK